MSQASKDKRISPLANGQPAAGSSSAADIARFLEQAKTIKPSEGGKGRIVLALDATMSRQPTWDMAARIQADMFQSAAATGQLSMQLVYFRGFGECRASKWVRGGQSLASMMAKIDCRAGQTQIAKMLKHVDREHTETPISAVIYIGDAMEENPDMLGHQAGTLGMRNVPIFVFQEGNDRSAEVTFREMARLSRGCWFRFDRSSPEALRKLLSSIAVYASGGYKALQARGRKEDQMLIEQMSNQSGRR